MTRHRARRLRLGPAHAALAVASSLTAALALRDQLALATAVGACIAAGALMLHTHRRAPDDAREPAPPPGHALQQAIAGDQAGRYSYERTLGELLQLVGRPVRVMVMDADGMPAARLCGRFHGATNLAAPGEPELLLFAVGQNGWLVLGRDEFAGACPLDNAEQLGLSMRLGTLTVAVLDEQASRDREALASELRAEP